MRILIAGAPRAGKTTLADRLGKELGLTVLHTDDLIGKMGWSEASEEVSTWIATGVLAAGYPPIIEGVSVPRALRKWLAAHTCACEKPADRIYWLTRPFVALTPGQQTMAKGCNTVWQEILPDLQRRGIEILSSAS